MIKYVSRIASKAHKLLKTGPVQTKHLFLGSWALALNIGPRFELWGLSGDLRVQDLTFIPIALAAYFLIDGLAVIKGNRPSDTLFVSLWVCLLGLLMAVFFAILFSNSIWELALRVGFSVRYFELPLTAILIARIASTSIKLSVIAFTAGVLLGGVLNLTWIALQLLLDFKRPALSFSSTVPSMYGPGLVGEGGVFGTGQNLTILLAVVIGLLLVSNNFWTELLLTFGAVAIVIGLFEVNSRTSIGSSAAIATIAIGLWIRERYHAKGRPVILLSFMLPALAVFVIVWLAVPRLRPSPALGALENRYLNFTHPTLLAIESREIFGLGPGGTRHEIKGETHNMFAGVLGDFGLVGLLGIFFLTIFSLFIARQEAKGPSSRVSRFLTLMTVFLCVNYLLASLAQDALLPVNSTQLAAGFVGLFVSRVRFRNRELASMNSYVVGRQ